MLIKIRIDSGIEGAPGISPGEQYVIIDRVSNIRFRPNPHEFTRDEEVIEFLKGDFDRRYLGVAAEHRFSPDCAGDNQPLSEKYRYYLQEITFERDNELHRFVFDNVAYICTDEGKTLERVYAGAFCHAG